MLQLPLFDDMDPVPRGAGMSAEESVTSGPASPADDEHRWLFDPAIVLRAEMDDALEMGRFDEARWAYRKLLEQWGREQGLDALAFLDRLDVPLDVPLERLLPSFLECVPFDGGMEPERRRAWRGLVRRLLVAHEPDTIVSAERRCLVPIVNALHELSRDMPGLAAQARDLVRDALLDGVELRPADFADARLRDLLAEDRTPEWLACLGAIRRLWHAIPASEAMATRALSGGGGDARHFWDCLRIAWSPLPDALRQEARRRMKRLDPELHRLVMRM